MQDSYTGYVWPAIRKAMSDQYAAAAFSRQSATFDKLDRSNKLSAHLRSRFRAEVMSYHSSPAKILELNCGTGLDAIYFAKHGHYVLATDAAPGMISEVEKKILSNEVPVSARLLSFHDLHELRGQKFDHIVSSFGGLNCSPDLEKVLASFDELLVPGGKVTLVIMPRWCPWEWVMVVKGKFRTAFRRFSGKTIANVEGEKFMCYYYGPAFVKRALRAQFKTLRLTGLYITVPPEFYAGFVDRYPRLYGFLSRIDDRIGRWLPFNRLCDHYMITLEKR